jgi:hypothetical protein
MKTLALLLVTLLLGGCAAPLQVSKLNDFNPTSDRLILLSKSRWDINLRLALAKKKFTVLKFASQETVIKSNDSKTESEIFDRAEARYAITAYYEQVDEMMIADTKKLNITLEVSDIKSNEVVLVIRKGGWSDKVFDELADELRKNWK